MQEVLPAAVSIARNANNVGRWTISNAVGDPIGEVARTLPIAKGVVGYRGPTEALIVLDNDQTITAVSLLQSADTHEHVEAVIRNEQFFRQFHGWIWNDPPSGRQIDAVSGATLTSLALAEGVLKRMGGDGGSLIFTDDLVVEEIRDWFPDAMSLVKENSFYIVMDSTGQSLGRVLRTGPFSDDVMGYQGPTELLMRIAGDDQVSEIRIRKSYDNEPYVDYVRIDKYSWSRLTGRTLADLSEFDPAGAGIEGVSGATMTSLAVADTVVAASKQVIAAEAEVQKSKSTVWSSVKTLLASARWTTRDLATIVTLLIAALISQWKGFHHRIVRRVWLIWVILVIGLWSGNLVSMALVAGWSAEGIAWQLAPGLASIAAVAMILPPLTKGNPYCNHLCPHGAVQQWIKPSSQSKRKWKPSARRYRWLKLIPGATLVLAYLTLITMPAIDLSSWEPFHAYLFRIAGWGSIALCALTLVVAMFVPMGYCRLGCPTGRLIDYVRRTAKSDRIEFADVVAVALLIFALAAKSM